MNEPKLLTWAMTWCQTVPAHSRWWVSDPLFASLALALRFNARYRMDEPTYGPFKLMLRTVSILPLSRLQQTRKPCKECRR